MVFEDALVGMDAGTQSARNLKAEKIRECRKYLHRAQGMGLSEKSTSVRYWRKQVQEWRETEIDALKGLRPL